MSIKVQQTTTPDGKFRLIRVDEHLLHLPEDQRVVESFDQAEGVRAFLAENPGFWLVGEDNVPLSGPEGSPLRSGSREALDPWENPRITPPVLNWAQAYGLGAEQTLALLGQQTSRLTDGHAAGIDLASGPDGTVTAVMDFETTGQEPRVVEIRRETRPFAFPKARRYEVPEPVSGAYYTKAFSNALWDALLEFDGQAAFYELREVVAKDAGLMLALWFEDQVGARLLAEQSFPNYQHLGQWWSNRTGSLVYTITPLVKKVAPSHNGVPLPSWWWDFEDLVEHCQGRVSTIEIRDWFRSRVSSSGADWEESCDLAQYHLEHLLTLVRATGLLEIETVHYDTYSRTYVHAHGH